MTRCVVSASAEADLEEIADYIAADNPLRAVSFVQQIRKQFAKIARTPQAFRTRSELSDGLRSYPFRRYVIFYRIEHLDVRIVRVLHGARDLEHELATP